MTENKIKLIRWLIAFLIILPYLLDVAWFNYGAKCAYWASPILKYSLFSLVGLLFIVFPRGMTRLLFKLEDHKEIQRWRLVLSGIIAGIILSLVGIPNLISIINRWATECSFILNCMPLNWKLKLINEIFIFLPLLCIWVISKSWALRRQRIESSSPMPNKACTRRWGFCAHPKQFSTPQHFSSRTASRRPPQRG